MINILKEFSALDLPLGEYAIIGGGPLAVRGLREPHDIDVIVKDGLWNELKSRFKEKLDEDGLSLIIGSIEIYPEWVKLKEKTDEMIDTAEMIDGLPFVKLEYMIEWKKMMGREKDKKDLALIEEYLRVGVK